MSEKQRSDIKMSKKEEENSEIFKFFEGKHLRAWHLRTYMSGRKETEYWSGTDSSIHELLDWLRKEAKKDLDNSNVFMNAQGIEELDNGEWYEYYNSDGYGADELLDMYVADINEYMDKLEEFLDFLDEGDEISLYSVLMDFEEEHIVHPRLESLTVEQVAALLDESKFDILHDDSRVVVRMKEWL